MAEARPRRSRGASRARERASLRVTALPPDHPDWRPVGFDGVSPVQFARDVHTAEQLEAFLERLRDGSSMDLAAREIGSRGRLMQRFADREPAFAELVEEAMAVGRRAYQDRLRDTARARATRLDGGSDRLLEVELATHVPGYEHLRRDRVKVGGTVHHEHALVIDPTMLGRLTEEQLVSLRQIVAAMSDDDVIDAAAVVRQVEAGGDGS